MDLSPALLQQLARLSGLTLTAQQAAELSPVLRPVLDSAPHIARPLDHLPPGTPAAVGSTWPQDRQQPA